MKDKIYRKFKNNLHIYKEDLGTKGLYYSIIHRFYKISLLKFLLTPIVNFLKPDYILIDNQKIYIDKSDTTISEKLVLSKKWEEFESELFKKNIKEGDIILDVGAHIGYYTLIASKYVGKNGQVFAFEPDSKNFGLLEKNIKENKLKNVILVNKPVTRKGGKIKLYLNKKNTGDHRIYNSKDGRESIVINSVSLDDFFKDFKKRISLIKMDIQGAELEAISGGLSLIKNNPNIKIFIEFWPMGLKLNHSQPYKLLELLNNLRFKFYQIDEEDKKIEIINPSKLLKLYPSNSENYTNLYCVRGSKK